MPLVYASITVLLLLCIPQDAFAWGPGTHVQIALTALAHAAALAPGIAALIQKFPEAFIYGSASPDIVVGKKYAGYFHHCHNWRMGRLILAEAESDLQRAAAYGYLMHLAADVVAHNYYIPVKIVRSYDARMLTHTYWEMRFDLGVQDAAWKALSRVTAEEVEEFDHLLSRVLVKTLFSFSTNKHIFNSILILQKMHGMRASLRLYAKHSRYEISEENRSHYLELAIESALDFLRCPEQAACLEVDPAGLARLEYAKQLRRAIRGMLLRGLMREAQAKQLVDLTKDTLAMALYRPQMRLPGVEDVLP